MNERDSEWVTGILLDKGFRKVDSPKEADAIIFNTCSVRKHAEDRAISNMGQLARIKQKRPGAIFGVIGCTAEYYGKELFSKLPHVDFVCGTANIHRVAELIERTVSEKRRQLAIGDTSRRLPELRCGYRSDRATAYVSISRGCDNYCSYCVVPYVRGPERSRMPEDIIEEVKDLIKRGCGDITLLGQNVNSYGKDLKGRIDFVKLLKMINRQKGLKNIGFLTSHPKDASLRLFKAMRRLKGLSKHLHLPVQSGSDRILKAMNRGYTAGHYMKLVERFRKIVPKGKITTDIIVGFPDETEEDYEATKSLLKKVEFDACYIFKYSPRPPAPSSKMKDDVLVKEKERRHRELLEIQKSISNRKSQKR
jgi:tRNA-2-methylthio-N6-dimethylallyladenosine synthase